MTNGPRRWLTDPRTIRVCRILIGILFGWAGLAKLGDLQSFAEQIHNFRVLPLALENLAAAALPWIELITALALIVDVRARSGAWIAAGMMALFTVAVLAALLRGLDIECGCFGTSDASRVGLAKIAQNAGMLIVALVASLAIRREPNPSGRA